MAAPEPAEPLQSIVPAETKQLRACLFCSLVKTWAQFEFNGCENCPFLEMEEDPENIGDCTSSNFDGMVAMMKPDESWVAKWQGLRGTRKSFQPGVYALSVTGKLPQHVIKNLEAQKIRYVSRDRTRHT
ncbi:transcription elongation factor spt4 [Balamuthia mandrillaris]